MPELSTADLEGKRVYAQHGRDVGTVAGVQIDLEVFRVVALEIKLRREVLESLNLKVPLLGSQSIYLGVEHVSAVTDTIVLKSTVQELAELASGAHEVPSDGGEE
jgi:sporulation protein YlmC with PRC-barrel domain